MSSITYTTRVYTHNMNSASAIAVRNELNVRMLRTMNPAVTVRNIINWGSSTTPSWDDDTFTWLNKPSKVAKYVNKLTFAQTIVPSNPSLYLQHYDNVDDALTALVRGASLYERADLTGSGGSGIHYVESVRESLTQGVELWTKAEIFNREYRVNAVEVDGLTHTYIARKRRADGWRDLNEYSPTIRSEGTGWRFCALRDEDLGDVPLLKTAVEEYFSTCPAEYKLDFAGFDVGITPAGLVKIIEVNTAPGVGDTSTLFYANYFREMFDPEAVVGRNVEVPRPDSSFDRITERLSGNDTSEEHVLGFTSSLDFTDAESVLIRSICNRLDVDPNRLTATQTRLLFDVSPERHPALQDMNIVDETKVIFDDINEKLANCGDLPLTVTFSGMERTLLDKVARRYSASENSSTFDPLSGLDAHEVRTLIADTFSSPPDAMLLSSALQCFNSHTVMTRRIGHTLHSSPQQSPSLEESLTSLVEDSHEVNLSQFHVQEEETSSDWEEAADTVLDANSTYEELLEAYNNLVRSSA